MIRRRLALGLLAAGLLLLVASFSLLQLSRAHRFARAGEHALRQAELALRNRELVGARAELIVARSNFEKVQREMRTLGPLLSVGRHVPVVGPQVRAADALTRSGLGLSTAGLHLSAAAEALTSSRDPGAPFGRAIESIRDARVPLSSGLRALDGVEAQLERIDSHSLSGPLGRAERDLSRRLGRARSELTAAIDGVDALLVFAGDHGPRRYLILSQNPDEARPTGGFIGTYGVLAASGGRFTLERYADMVSWVNSHPGAVVPFEEVSAPFRFYEPPLVQSLANVNSVPDWSHAARLARELWMQAGEVPVDGVLGLTPGLLVRLLGVTGPVTLAQYDETVTAANVVERLDHHTHAARSVASERKDFVTAVAESTLRTALETPRSRWDQLGRAVGDGFGAREAMAWFVDPTLQRATAARGWDGTLPEGSGDFVCTAEFSYAAKNGRGLQRTYDHHVQLRQDGSARVTTTLTIFNGAPPDPILNPSSLSYITMYGPVGAVVDDGASGFPTPEPAIAGHPGVGWFRAAEPSGSTSLTVVWDVPKAAVRIPHGMLQYNLRFLRLPDHTGDRLHLTVDPPPGWRWAEERPPTVVMLDRDVVGSWPLVADRRT